MFHVIYVLKTVRTYFRCYDQINFEYITFSQSFSLIKYVRKFTWNIINILKKTNQKDLYFSLSSLRVDKIYSAGSYPDRRRTNEKRMFV